MKSAEIARQMSDMRDRKPRPLHKMFGRNPTEEQQAKHAKLMQVWNREYRKLSKQHKLQLAIDNENYRKQRETN